MAFFLESRETGIKRSANASFFVSKTEIVLWVSRETRLLLSVGEVVAQLRKEGKKRARK